MDQIKENFIKWKRYKRDKYRDILFKEIWEVYHSKLQVYVSQFYNLDMDSTDRASEVLIKVFESIESYNSSYSFSTWIYRIARNQQIDHLRKRKITHENIDDHILTDSNTPESITIRDSEQLQVRDAVSTLRETDRELIYLHFYEELKYSQISEITGMPVGTIKFRMSECRKQLKLELLRS